MSRRTASRDRASCTLVRGRLLSPFARPCDTPAKRSVPSSVLGEAAAVCNDEWYKKLAPVPGRAAHLRLVFDGASAALSLAGRAQTSTDLPGHADDVSLLYWHKALRFEHAGLELDAETVPTPAQPLGIFSIGGYGDTDYLKHSSFDPESELVRGHVGEHLGVYTVSRLTNTLPFELASVMPTLLANVNPPRPAPPTHHKLVQHQPHPHAPLTTLRPPLLLLRTLDRLLLSPSPLDPPRRLALPGLPSHLLSRDPSTAPHIPVELALVLRTLRILFDLESIPFWLRELADGRSDALRRLLAEPSVARAQAEVECGWWAGGVEGGSSAVTPPTVGQLEQRNRGAWVQAWALFEAFVLIVKTPGDPRKAHSRFF
ncbi:hypothetical protein JCM8208_006335 [Rhodotorula glutinis]